MKYYTIILLFLVALLNPDTSFAGSCCEHKSEVETEQTMEDASSCSDTEEEGCCGTEECSCVCCSSIVIMMELKTSEWAYSDPNGTTVSPLETDYLFEPSLAIWHPPKRLA